MLGEHEKRVAELMEKLHQSTSVEEVLQTGALLGMDFTRESAEEYLNLLMEDEQKPEGVI